MRKQLITGFAVSAVLHAGFVYGGNLFSSQLPPASPPDAPKNLARFVMPPITPDQTDEVQKVKDLKEQENPAVPNLPDDPPRVPIKKDIVQPIEPPMPTGNTIDRNTIPVNPPTPNSARFKEIFNSQDLTRQPEALTQGRPNYPYDLVKQGLEGSATVAFVVTKTGEVVDVHAVGSSNREFERPAVEAVSRWKFRAGMKDNRAVNTRMVVEINFKLNE